MSSDSLSSHTSGNLGGSFYAPNAPGSARFTLPPLGYAICHANR